VIALDVRAAANDAAQSRLPAIIRSLQCPNAIGFAKYLASQTMKSSILGADGLEMGEIINVDRERVLASGNRLVRGFYYLEIGRPVPEMAILTVGAKTGPTLGESDMATIARGFATYPDHLTGEAGKAFSYAAAFAPAASFWIILLYDYFFWAATIDERGVSDQGPTVPLNS
jgi:hypothetical protein